MKCLFGRVGIKGRAKNITVGEKGRGGKGREREREKVRRRERK